MNQMKVFRIVFLFLGRGSLRQERYLVSLDNHV